MIDSGCAYETNKNAKYKVAWLKKTSTPITQMKDLPKDSE